MKKILSILFPWRRSDEALEAAAEQVNNKSFWNETKKHFRKNRVAVWAWRCILAIAVLAVLADFIANEKPLVCKYKGSTYFPVMRSYMVDLGVMSWPKDLQNVRWSELEYDWVVFPPVPYLPTNLDNKNTQYVSPFGDQNVKSTRWRHWMGTDDLGRDILSGMIHGTRIALIVGIVSMSIAGLIGILLGSLAGYFGDERLKISRGRIFVNVIIIPLAFFYAFGVRSYTLKDALSENFTLFLFHLLISICLFGLISWIGNYPVRWLKKSAWLSKRYNIPMDMLISRLIELMLSVPTLFLIISIASVVSKPSIFITMTIIGLTGWTGIARFIRAELLRVRSLDYIEAANAMGFNESRIIFRHAIPNAISPVLIALAFGVASSILVESTLSFLGLGVSADTVTWGSLLTKARQAPSAWWLAIFPGLAIFMTVTVYNLVGEGLTDAMDPKLRK